MPVIVTRREVCSFDADEPAAQMHVPIVMPDGAEYTVDLSERRLKELREFLSAYADKGTKVGKFKTSAPPVSSPDLDRTGAWYRTAPGDNKVVQARKRTYRQRAADWAAKHGGWERNKTNKLPGRYFVQYDLWCRENGQPTGPESVGL